MHPIRQETFTQKVLLKLQRIFSYKLINWYKLGEAQQTWYLKKLFKLYAIDFVIDAGGNTGQYAKFLRNKVGYRGKILTIEPMPQAAKMLRENFKNDQNWSLEQCAVSDVAGFAEFNILRGHQMSSMLQPSSSTTDVLEDLQTIVEKVTVQVKTLDSIFDKHPFCEDNNNVYLKLDIQGKELEALNGCSNNLHKVIAIQAELNVVPIYEGMHKYFDLMKEIESLGYILSLLPAHSYRLFPDMIDFDAHFVKKSKMAEKGYLKNAT